MKANCFVLAAAAAFAFTGGAFGENETERFFDKLKPQEAAMNLCYEFNIIRFAMKTCEPASTVVDAAYGRCHSQEKAYASAYERAMIKSVGQSHGESYIDDAEQIISMAKQRMRQTFLARVLDDRIKGGVCAENSN